METESKADRLREMLKLVASGKDVRTLPRKAGAFESLESTSEAPPNVDSGLEKVAEDRAHELTAGELSALEAIVMPQNRPVVLILTKDSVPSYSDIGEPWLALNQPDVRARISRVLPSIGRIELPLSPLIPYGGTGFIVGDGLLMTNRHVAQLFSQGLGLKIRYQTGGSAVDFKRQKDTPDNDHTSLLTVRNVVMIHPYWDMALLAVSGLTSDQVLPLSVVSPEKLAGRNVVVIGYPAKDFRNDFKLQDEIFEHTYNVKRLQPGVIRPRSHIKSFENVVNALTHDASTLGGNSGSAIVDVDTGEVVALHFAGEYLKANYAVPMFELARDSRVAPRLNFRGKLPPPTDEWDGAWQGVEVGEAPVSHPYSTSIAKSSAQVPQLQSVPALSPVASPVPRVGATANWTIPLHISISIGPPGQGDEAGLPVSTTARFFPAEGEVEGVLVNQDYTKRPGYDPDFLEELSVDLPRITKNMEIDTAKVQPEARKNGDPFELSYYHYSIYMNKRRRTAWFSAANVDGDRRPNIGKRQGDRWYVDPRILRSEQLGQEAFEPGMDRGHLTRREDTAWGEDVESATLANNDTFHFTNCALQASAFNRGKDRWQGLEQFLLEQHAKKDKRRMVVITGPIFRAHDPAYKNDRMNYTVRCPLQFWKVCVLIRENGTPSATAFVLGQEEIKDLPGFEEAFDVAATQITIADLEEQTGLDFGELRNYDHFAQHGPGTIEGVAGNTAATKGGRIIRELADIVV